MSQTEEKCLGIYFYHAHQMTTNKEVSVLLSDALKKILYTVI